MNKNGNDKQTAIWAACESALKEGSSTKEITGRKIAARPEVEWSHTTVTPCVTAWHDQRINAEQEALAKTQMSIHFVKALQGEVNERVSRLRSIDDEQMQLLQNELSDMITANTDLERELTKSNSQLADKSVSLTTATTELRQAKTAKAELETELATKVSNHEVRQEKTNTDHSKALNELNAQHQQSIDKLNDRLEVKSKEIADINAKYARAEVKAEQHEQLTEDLATSKVLTNELTNSNMQLTAELDATNNMIAALQTTLSDAHQQRDKAQKREEELALEMNVINNQLVVSREKIHNTELAAAIAGITLNSESVPVRD